MKADVTSAATAIMKLLFGRCNCTVYSNVGSGYLWLMLGILHLYKYTHMQFRDVLMEAWGGHNPNIFKIAKKFAKSQCHAVREMVNIFCNIVLVTVVGQMVKTHPPPQWNELWHNLE